MKKLISSTILIFTSCLILAQAQPQGELHKYILKKTNEIRKTTKPENWLNKGVVVFSLQEIKRLSTVAETEKNLSTKFKAGETFYGRAYMPQSIGQLERKPSSIITRFYLDGKMYNSEIIYSGENMLDADWSSWSYIFPEDMPKMADDLTPGEHTFKMEIWTNVPTEKTTTYVDENDKTVGTKKEEINLGQFLGAGEFIIVK